MKLKLPPLPRRNRAMHNARHAPRAGRQTENTDFNRSALKRELKRELKKDQQ